MQNKRVENVIWPLIFQKRVMKEITVDTKKSASEISDSIGS